MSRTSEKGELVGELESEELEEEAERMLRMEDVGLVRPLEGSESEAQPACLVALEILRNARRSWRWMSDSTNCICLPLSSNLLEGMKVMIGDGPLEAMGRV